MLSPIAAWIAVCDSLAWPPVLLAAIVFFWVGGFDIIYACQDAEFDQQKRLNSIPAKIGVAGALRIAFASHVLTIACLFALWSAADLGIVFLCGVIFVAVLLMWQHWLVRPDDLTRVNIAFFNVNAIISIGLLIVAAADLWLC
jgi:4-hydroxybenzoate polyprenyltransferase